MFMGEYHHNIDDKGRLTLPSKIREGLGEHFIVTRGMDHCLFVYKQEDWTRIIKRYQELPNTKDARDYMRFFMSGASEQEFDKQGRINIASPLVKYASLDRDCIIIGVNDHVEIWSQTLWNQFIETREEEFSDIADHLFSI